MRQAMQHLNRGLYLKLILLSILAFFLFQGANLWQQPEPPIEPADIYVLVDRSKSLDFVAKDLTESVEFTLRYLQTFDPRGDSFRVAIIPFWGKTRDDFSLQPMEPEFWEDFVNKFSPATPADNDYKNTDFSRVFCQLRRTLKNQQIRGYNRQTVILLFSDGKSQPFGDTKAWDVKIQDCFSDLSLPSDVDDLKTSDLDVQFAASIFDAILKNNVAPKLPKLYTVIYKTTQRIADEKAEDDLKNTSNTWWIKPSNEYLPYCVEESSDTGDCSKTGDKAGLLDFLNRVVVSGLLKLPVVPFQTSRTTTIEIRPHAYTMEMRISVLRNRQDVHLSDANNREQPPLPDMGADFSIYRIPVPPETSSQVWRLTMPIGSDYRIDYVEPALQFAPPSHDAWTGNPFEVDLETLPESPSAERLPDEIAVHLADTYGRPISGSEMIVNRYGRNHWTGVLNSRSEFAAGFYTLYLDNPDLQLLLAPDKAGREINMHKPAHLGDLKPHYEPKTQNWILTISVVNAESLPNYIVEAYSSLNGGLQDSKTPSPKIENGQIIFNLSEKDYPAGEYQFDLKLMPQRVPPEGMPPKENRSFVVNLYTLPKIEKVQIDSPGLIIGLSLSNYYPSQYQNLYVELVNPDDDRVNYFSEKLDCRPQKKVSFCSGQVLVNWSEDFATEYKFNKIILRGKLTSGNEITLSYPQIGILSFDPTTFVMSIVKKVLTPINLSILLMVCVFLACIIYYISPWLSFRRLIAKFNQPKDIQNCFSLNLNTVPSWLQPLFLFIWLLYTKTYVHLFVRHYFRVQQNNTLTPGTEVIWLLEHLLRNRTRIWGSPLWASFWDNVAEYIIQNPNIDLGQVETSLVLRGQSSPSSVLNFELIEWYSRVNREARNSRRSPQLINYVDILDALMLTTEYPLLPSPQIFWGTIPVRNLLNLPLGSRIRGVVNGVINSLQNNTPLFSLHSKFTLGEFDFYDFEVLPSLNRDVMSATFPHGLLFMQYNSGISALVNQTKIYQIGFQSLRPYIWNDPLQGSKFRLRVPKDSTFELTLGAIYNRNITRIAFQTSKSSPPVTVNLNWFVEESRRAVWGKNIKLGQFLRRIRSDAILSQEINNINNPTLTSLFRDLLITDAPTKVQISGWNILGFLDKRQEFLQNILVASAIVQRGSGQLKNLVPRRSFQGLYDEIDNVAISDNNRLYGALLSSGVIIQGFDVRKIKSIYIIPSVLHDVLHEIANSPNTR